MVLVLFRPHPITTYIEPIATDGAVWSVSWSVCHDREPVPANAAVPIEMPFGNWYMDLVGPRNNVLDGVQIHHAKGQF